MRRIIVIFYALFTAHISSAATLGDDDLQRVARSADALRVVARFDQALQDREPDAIAAMLNEIANESREVLQHYLLVEGALRLAQLDASPAATAALEQMAQRPVAVWIEHEHAGRRTPIPAYDPAAAARYALKRQQTARDAAQLASLLTRGAPLSSASSAASRTAASALGKTQLRESLPALKLALNDNPTLGAALIQAAQQVNDAEALSLVIQRGHAADAHSALRAASEFDGALDRRVLDAAIARPETRSAALYQLARDVAQDPALTPQLMAWLDHDATALPAAAAVAQLDRSDLAVSIGQQLATETRADRAHALALALMLMRNAQAQTSIDAYLDNPNGLPELKSKMAARRTQVTP